MPAPVTPVTSLARQLSDADANGIRLESASLLEPGSREDAIAVQHETLRLNDWLTGGYKVSIRPDGSSISAPMAHITHASDAGTAAFERPVLDALEVEICFVLGTDLPPPGSTAYTRETVLEHVGAIYSGVEFLAQRLDNGSRSPALLFLADRLGNAGYILGEELTADLLEPGLAIPLTITINGDTIFPGPGNHPNVDPVAPLVTFANALTETVAKGRIITTGSLCGAVPIPKNLPKNRAAIAISGFTTLAVTAISTRGA